MSEALQVAGGIAAAAAAAYALLGTDRRLRAVAMALALLGALALIAGQAWDGQLAGIRDEPLKLAALILGAAAALGVLAAGLGRRAQLLPLALVAMLPFRIPVDAGGESSNLLLPLYAVIAAGVAIELWSSFRGDADPSPRREGPARWLGLALAGAILLYAFQAAYSSDAERATQNIAFFFVPFALLFVFIRDADWSPGLLRAALVLVAAEGVSFALIGIVQHETHHIFWNEKTMESNEFDLEFRVNSLFWDPNIYGRYLALTILLAASALAWVRDARHVVAGVAAIAVMFIGLELSFSQTSLFALLAGLAVLVALRWSVRWTILAGGAAAVAGAIVLLFAAGSTIQVGGGQGNSLDQTTSGRSRLARGGLDLAKARPVAGFGSGSFVAEFEERNPVAEREAAVSHTEPITIAAEQGAVGILMYLALLGAAAAVLLSALRGASRRPAAVALAVAFAALFVHTIGYAGFLTDPLTWALLAVASTLSLPVDRRPIPPNPCAPEGTDAKRRSRR